MSLPKKIKKFFIIGFLLFNHSHAELIEIHHQATVDTKVNSSVQKDITEKAVEEISNRYIAELIGEGKLKKHKSEIDSKIIKN